MELGDQGVIIRVAVVGGKQYEGVLRPADRRRNAGERIGHRAVVGVPPAVQLMGLVADICHLDQIPFAHGVLDGKIPLLHVRRPQTGVLGKYCSTDVVCKFSRDGLGGERGENILPEHKSGEGFADAVRNSLHKRNARGNDGELLVQETL